MQAVTGNAITVVIDGQEVRTLRDTVPETPGLKVLLVAKTPAPGSVEVGHYSQGVQGRLFWTKMKQYGLCGRRQILRTVITRPWIRTY